MLPLVALLPLCNGHRVKLRRDVSGPFCLLRNVFLMKTATERKLKVLRKFHHQHKDSKVEPWFSNIREWKHSWVWHQDKNFAAPDRDRKFERRLQGAICTATHWRFKWCIYITRLTYSPPFSQQAMFTHHKKERPFSQASIHKGHPQFKCLNTCSLWYSYL